MKKLIQGLIDFQQQMRPGHRETFARLALGQSPDTLFIACSDSRVAPNVFASTDPGDMFVIRNVGNIIPPCGGFHGLSATDESEAAAIEFAILNLGVSDIVVCGHSECGAMQALTKGRLSVESPNLRSWLRHGDDALKRLEQDPHWAPQLSPHNRLSQLNVLLQLENLGSYPVVQEKMAAGTLRLHGWWFELAKAKVHCFDVDQGQFVEIDPRQAERILRSMNKPPQPVRDQFHDEVRT